MLVISMNTSDDIGNPQLDYRHVTSSVNNVKSENAIKNTNALMSMLGEHVAACYGGGTNDNAYDAQKEITSTHLEIMNRLRESNNISPETLQGML